MTARRARLPGERWHLSEGPIDLVIGAAGEPSAVQQAHEAAWVRFATILSELVAELPLLRRPVGPRNPLAGPIARRMWAACHPYRPAFITPMAAVAGAVAEEIAACYARPGVCRAWVNNGGDIALLLTGAESLAVGLCADAERRPSADGRVALDATLRIDASMPVRGVATSGWRGRSHSLGIADAVTVLARSAAEADAAATMIANAVNVADARIVRRPACTLKDDSDLGEIPVTVQVPPLEDARIDEALAAGIARARALQAAGRVYAVALVCQRRAAWLAPPAATSRVEPLQFGSVIA